MFQDGGAVVNFGEPMQEQAMAGHLENLAELLEDDVLNEISNEVLEALKTVNHQEVIGNKLT